MSNYRICTRCIMDSTDPEIQFDENSVCNHCKRAEELIDKNIIKDSEERKSRLDQLVNKMKQDGKGKEYDCLIGISGGVDSTYVAYKVKELGLRPLAVHLDNSWNSELSVSNIEKTLKKLGIDLYTHVLDWEEFKDLQLSFLKASVPDLEIPTDHAINALLRSMAIKQGVKYMIFGLNTATESILPRAWSYGHLDWKYIYSIQKRFGTMKLTTFPHIKLYELVYQQLTNRLQIINILDYLDYSKKEAIEVLQGKLGWQYYGGKHYESVYTRFVQGYILPIKFNYDKRRAHLSSLIMTGEMTREQALEEIQEPIYPDGMLEQDKQFVVNKFCLTFKEFDSLISMTNHTFSDYSSYTNGFTYKALYKVYKYFRK